MKRGVLSFRPDEILEIGTMLHSIEPQPIELTQKFTIDKDADEHVIIQLSEDEVEIILDSLPMPAADEPSPLTHVRNKLSAFLSQLRVS